MDDLGYPAGFFLEGLGFRALVTPEPLPEAPGGEPGDYQFLPVSPFIVKIGRPQQQPDVNTSLPFSGAPDDEFARDGTTEENGWIDIDTIPVKVTVDGDFEVVDLSEERPGHSSSGSCASSLHWLLKTHMNDDRYSQSELLARLHAFMGPNPTQREVVEAKLTVIDELELPIRVKYQSIDADLVGDVNSPIAEHGHSAGDSSFVNQAGERRLSMNWAWDELEDDEDVELLVGIRNEDGSRVGGVALNLFVDDPKSRPLHRQKRLRLPGRDRPGRERARPKSENRRNRFSGGQFRQLGGRYRSVRRGHAPRGRRRRIRKPGPDD